jgi:hypothetical protein
MMDRRSRSYHSMGSALSVGVFIAAVAVIIFIVCGGVGSK